MRKNLYSVPKNKQVRVIIDTDAGAEADDQFAIVYGLLSPKLDVKGIIAEQFTGHKASDSMLQSYAEIKTVLSKMGLESSVPVYKGEVQALGEAAIKEGLRLDEKMESIDRTELSEGVRFIIEEAMKEDERPLFVLNMGALTNLATAILHAPSIAEKITAVWIGGGSYPIGHMDFNLANDIKAANTVLESNVELWQIPLGSYTKMAVTFHELFEKVQPCGAIGAYLVDKMMQVNEKECASDMEELDFFGKMTKGEKTVFIRTGEGWSLGDNPAVGVLISPQSQYVEKRPAQFFNPNGTYGPFVGKDRMVRVYTNLDSRVLLEDFFAKINYHYGNPGTSHTERGSI